METERGLGFEPTDREFDKLGYDIESRDPASSLPGRSSGRLVSGKMDAPRFVSSDASTTRPECAVTRLSTPATMAAAVNRNPIICADSGTTRVARLWTRGGT